MTTPNSAAQVATQHPIDDAIVILTEEADSLSECHTFTPEDWSGEPEAKARYDHIQAVVAALSKLRAPVADEQSVTSILLEVVPGEDGMGHEVYATSVEDVKRHMAVLADELEEWELGIRRLPASAPVAKPKRAPLDDWRVQAIAECLETEWDDMTPASAEEDARLIVGYLIAYEKESDQIEARHAAEPVDPVVQAVRDLRASAPVAGDVRPPMLPRDALEALRDFKLTVIQDGFHKIAKPMIRQLSEAGALESRGFGKHRLTQYGEWLLSATNAVPLADRDGEKLAKTSNNAGCSSHSEKSERQNADTRPRRARGCC